MRAPSRLLLRLLVPCALLAACGGGEEEIEPLFPLDYIAAGYAEGRSCRGSADHDLSQVHIFASPTALDPYVNRTASFPEGAIIVKEEHDFTDDDCTGPILGYAVMFREAASTEALGWRWQKVDIDHKVVNENDRRCIECHGGSDAGSCEGGFEATCADP